jgi:hypothetical protein
MTHHHQFLFKQKDKKKFWAAKTLELQHMLLPTIYSIIKLLHATHTRTGQQLEDAAGIYAIITRHTHTRTARPRHHQCIVHAVMTDEQTTRRTHDDTKQIKAPAGPVAWLASRSS